jgi:hypothetical protein
MYLKMMYGTGLVVRRVYSVIFHQIGAMSDNATAYKKNPEMNRFEIDS